MDKIADCGIIVSIKYTTNAKIILKYGHFVKYYELSRKIQYKVEQLDFPEHHNSNTIRNWLFVHTSYGTNTDQRQWISSCGTRISKVVCKWDKPDKQMFWGKSCVCVCVCVTPVHCIPLYICGLGGKSLDWGKFSHLPPFPCWYYCKWRPINVGNGINFKIASSPSKCYSKESVQQTSRKAPAQSDPKWDECYKGTCRRGN